MLTQRISWNSNVRNFSAFKECVYIVFMDGANQFTNCISLFVCLLRASETYLKFSFHKWLVLFDLNVHGTTSPLPYYFLYFFSRQFFIHLYLSALLYGLSCIFCISGKKQLVNVKNRNLIQKWKMKTQVWMRSLGEKE